MLAGVQHCMVFHAGSDDVITGLSERSGYAMNRGVVRLGPSAGENHFPGSAIEDLGHAFSGLVQDITGFLAHRVDTGGIAKMLGEIGNHGLKNLGVQGRGASMV